MLDLNPFTLPFAAPSSDDPDVAEIAAALSVGNSARGMSRRRFITAALAAGGVTALSAGPYARLARAAGFSPRPDLVDDPVVVLLQLGGGNDGLNTVIPVDDPRYATIRKHLAITEGTHRLGDSGLALHPALPRLAARFAAGEVAIVRGVGQERTDLSHFSSTANWMTATEGHEKATGWVGRYLDGFDDADEGFRGIGMGGRVPLTMLGERVSVTGVGVGEPSFGGLGPGAVDEAIRDVFSRWGDTATGFGRWGDETNDMLAAVVKRAPMFEPLYHHPHSPSGGFPRTLDAAAGVVNLGLGTRAISASLGTFDTHTSQPTAHHDLLAAFDEGVEAFYARLHPQHRDRVVLVTYSEFGRRATLGGSGTGTDHGTSAPVMVIGSGVQGGLYGTQPELDELTSNGDLATHVNFRSVYTSILGEHLGADPAEILGAEYPTVGIFGEPNDA